jgi:hypothetical protein
MTKQFKRNKVAIFKSATNKRKVNPALVGLFVGQKSTDLVNNKGMSTKNIRYNPEIINIKAHSSANMWNGR